MMPNRKTSFANSNNAFRIQQLEPQQQQQQQQHQQQQQQQGQTRPNRSRGSSHASSSTTTTNGLHHHPQLLPHPLLLPKHQANKLHGGMLPHQQQQQRTRSSVETAAVTPTAATSGMHKSESSSSIGEKRGEEDEDCCVQESSNAGTAPGSPKWGKTQANEVLLVTFQNMVSAGCDPLRYRTALCEFVTAAKCQYKNCFFHHVDENMSKRTVSENAKQSTQLVMYLLDARAKLQRQVCVTNLSTSASAESVDGVDDQGSTSGGSSVEYVEESNGSTSPTRVGTTAGVRRSDSLLSVATGENTDRRSLLSERSERATMSVAYESALDRLRELESMCDGLRAETIRAQRERDTAHHENKILRELITGRREEIVTAAAPLEQHHHSNINSQHSSPIARPTRPRTTSQQQQQSLHSPYMSQQQQQQQQQNLYSSGSSINDSNLVNESHSTTQQHSSGYSECGSEAGGMSVYSAGSSRHFGDQQQVQQQQQQHRNPTFQDGSTSYIDQHLNPPNQFRTVLSVPPPGLHQQQQQQQPVGIATRDSNERINTKPPTTLHTTRQIDSEWDYNLEHNKRNDKSDSTWAKKGSIDKNTESYESLNFGPRSSSSVHNAEDDDAAGTSNEGFISLSFLEDIGTNRHQ